jgi:hypothetical protein
MTIELSKLHNIYQNTFRLVAYLYKLRKIVIYFAMFGNIRTLRLAS